MIEENHVQVDYGYHTSSYWRLYAPEIFFQNLDPQILASEERNLFISIDPQVTNVSLWNSLIFGCVSASSKYDTEIIQICEQTYFLLYSDSNHWVKAFVGKKKFPEYVFGSCEDNRVLGHAGMSLNHLLFLSMRLRCDDTEAPRNEMWLMCKLTNVPRSSNLGFT